MSVQEVIDLTTESLVPLVIEINSSPSSSRDDRKSKRKRKSLNSKSSSATTPELPSTLSHSNELSTKSDHSAKRKRTNEMSESNGRCSDEHDDSEEQGKPDSADLFFVDLSPAVIPSIPVSQESTTNGENEKVEALLLPSHVTVFGSALVEIISQPLSDSDDNEFIKYLDYDDTRVGTQ